MNNAEWIIGNFKQYYLNKKGLISRTYPPSDRTIFDNFDDLAPFFLYYGEEDFLLEQIRRLGENPFETFLPFHNILYSYRIDEYIGGLYSLFRQTKNAVTKKLLDEAVEKCLRYFLRNGSLVEFYDFWAKKSSPYFSPWSSGLLETFLEMRDVYPNLLELVINVVHHWLRNQFYIQEGLFPVHSSNQPLYYSFGTFNARRKAYMQDCPQLYGFPHARSVFTVLMRFIYPLLKAQYIYATSGHYVQLMKSNTTMIFTLIELYRITFDSEYRKHIERWIEICLAKLVKDGMVYSFYYIPGHSVGPSLTSAFILIDVLCDTYWFVERNQKYLEQAISIADRQLATQWTNGLIPMADGSDRDHLDNQVDFAISLRRISELADRTDYIQQSYHIIEQAINFHRVENGFCTHVNSKSEPIYSPVNMVDPKYNGLLLKGLIHLSEQRKSIYNDPVLHDLFKDR